MAKVTGGLLSLGAGGTVGSTLTFSKWKGRPYVRQRVIPANPQSTAQTLTRDIFRNLNSIWKEAGALAVAPWDRFASGQALTGRNAFVGQNVAALRGEVDLAKMIFSPGAKGGLAPTAVSAVGVSGGVDVTITPPATPTGWTLQAGVAAMIIDGAPESITSFTLIEGEDLAAPYTINLPSANLVLHQCGGWLRWAKPDGSIAYGPSLGDTATPLA